MVTERYIFPERLKELRTREHISGRTLSELIGLSNGTVSRYERGERESVARTERVRAMLCSAQKARKDKNSNR